MRTRGTINTHSLRPFCLAIPIIILTAQIAHAGNPTEEVCFKGDCVKAEVADSLDARAQGLMHRESLKEDAGMLFVFGQEVLPSFWMKNVSLPLDIIWIDKDKKVIGFYPDAKPCADSCESIIPPGKIKYVLEVRAGFAEKIGLKPGDKASFGEQ